MEKFTNTTNSNKEKAIRVGNNVPSDSAGLAWFTSETISPKNNIITVNLSETIPENKIQESYQAELMYADELGILRRIDGRSEVSTDDITISNLLLDRPTASETYSINEINANNFGHYMYVSRYFTVLPPLFTLISLKSLPDQDTIYNLGIKVLDEYGKDYIDLNTKRKKYKILLEPFKTEYNVNLPEVPYRIIVILDSNQPVNIKLMYNKIECDEVGKVSNQQLRYTENINAVKYFNEVPEESFVIDPNYYGSNTFSIKKIDEKYSNINLGNKAISNGYQVIVPSKAIKDYRSYEVFNWRMIGKINKNINLEDVDYGLESDPSNLAVSRTIKAGILYSGTTGKNINPYVLYRLENSPFNLTKVIFTNPLATITEKNKADYWKINIDSVTSSQLNNFDILLWSPDSTITPYQAALINNFVSNNFGTLILDLSLCPSADALNANQELKMESNVTANVVSMVDTSIPIDFNKNGGWTINNSIFEKDYYSIIGSRLINGKDPKKYKYFSSASSNNTFVKAGKTTSNLKSLGVLLSYYRQNDNLTKGNIIATTFNLMAYCNNIYDIASSDKVVSTNDDAIHNGIISSSSGVFSSVVEGPFKLLFNCISYGAHCKALSNRKFTTSSSLINFVTNWSSSWVMYSDAIEDEEKSQFDLVSISASKSVYARNLTKNSLSSNTSIFDYFRSELAQKLPQFQRAIIDSLTVDDVDFYIEITNPDVKIKDSTKVSNPNSSDVDIPSSYILYKINEDTESRASDKPLYAYTEKYSRSLARIQGLGPHVLMERPINSSSSKNLLNILSTSSGFNSYPFKLKSYYSMYEGTDLPYNFDLTFSGKCTYKIEGQYKTKVANETEVEVPLGEISGTGLAKNVKSAIDDYNLNSSTNPGDSWNFFPYTGDIDIHGDPRIWKQGDTYPSSSSSTNLSSYSLAVNSLSVSTTSSVAVQYIDSWITFKEDEFGYLFKKVVTLYSDGYIGIEEFKANRIRNFELETFTQYRQAISNGTNGKFVSIGGDSKTVYQAISMWGANGSLTFSSTFGYIGTSLTTIYPSISEVSDPIEKQKYDTFVYVRNFLQQQPTSSTSPTTSTSPSRSSGSTSGSSGSSSHEYVKYIQYTLAAAGLYIDAIDGVYGSKTAAAVLAFQKKYNLRYKDSKVDSETKWRLALFWLSKKAFEGQKVLDDWKTFAGPEIAKYITKAENTALAADVNSGKPYRKITFTGFEGPAKGSDVLFFEVPSQMLKVTGITIIPDKEDSRWRNFRANAVGWGPTFNTNVFKYAALESLNLSAQSSDIFIKINDLKPDDCRYMFVSLEAFKLNGYGSGEGFGISGIKINGTIDGGSVTQTNVEYEIEYTPIDVTVEVMFTTTIKNISPSSPKSLSLKNPRQVSKLSHYISKLSYRRRNISFDEGELEIGSDGFENSKIKIKSFTRSKGNFSISNTDIFNIVSTVGSPITGIPVSYTENSNVFNFETSATYYGDSVIKTSGKDLSVGFRLKNLFGTILPESKNTINYGDGILLICDSNGKPAGIPTYEEIKSAMSATAYTNMKDQEKDLRYGYFTVYNQLSNEGLRYGFYDVSEKRFLGNEINYIDLYSRSIGLQSSPRNTSNIYIAICALDADGRVGDNEFFGINNSSTFLPSEIPLKYLVPVYSVKYKSNSSINVGAISDNISKFDAWELPISNGSFNKKIYIQPNIQWHDWKRNYSGQELLAEYSTLDIQNVSWSKIYGYGYYDIVDETPVFIDNKTIQVRRAPILSWNHPTDYLDSLVGVVKPEIKIYTRETKNDPWTEVSYSYVRDINCYTGIVSFKKSIVPSNLDLIKVSYTTENKNMLIRQINSNPVPLNPLLNNDTIIFDKPLYIYILPKAIYKYSKYTESLIGGEPVSSLGYEKLEEYTYQNAINYTYDPKIFDKNSVTYNPFALAIALIYVTNRPNKAPVTVTDIRLRGGGIKSSIENSKILDALNESSLASDYDVLSYWDMYPPEGNTYPKGGYVIVQIPTEVKNNFINNSDIRNIVSNNLTAGVVFDLQDLEGNSWS